MRETRCERCLTTLEDGDRCIPCLDSKALDTIANALDLQEWDADTCNIIADALRSTGRVVRDSAGVYGCLWCAEGIVSGGRCGNCGAEQALEIHPAPERLKQWLHETVEEQKGPPPAFKGGQGHTAEEIKESGGLWLGIIIVVFMFAAGIFVGWLSFHVR